MTAQFTIKTWFEEGQKSGCTHMVVATDTFDWSDYPVYTNDPQGEVDRLRAAPMSKVMEIYDLREDMKSQLNKSRCWSMPNASTQ